MPGGNAKRFDFCVTDDEYCAHWRRGRCMRFSQIEREGQIAPAAQAQGRRQRRYRDPSLSAQIRQQVFDKRIVCQRREINAAS